jgi:hypothetical protein
VDEVGELDAIADEKHGGVVSDDVVVAFGRVELERESAHVTPRVWRTLLAGDGREAREHVGLGTLLEHSCTRVLRHVFRDHEFTERSAALRVRVALRHTLAVERGELLDQVAVMQRSHPIGSSGERMLVARDGCPGLRGGVLSHDAP